MTKEEAIQILTDLQDGSGQTYEAIRFAIESLTNVQNLHNGDLISRADAIEAVRKKLQDWGGYAFEDYRRGLYEAQDIIEALPSAELPPANLKQKFESAEAEWIPCSERLPELHPVTYHDPVTLFSQYKISYPVLATVDGEVLIAEYEDDLDGRTAWMAADTEMKLNVIAWMPLPKPYREDGEE